MQQNLQLLELGEDWGHPANQFREGHSYFQWQMVKRLDYQCCSKSLEAAIQHTWTSKHNPGTDLPIQHNERRIHPKFCIQRVTGPPISTIGLGGEEQSFAVHDSLYTKISKEFSIASQVEYTAVVHECAETVEWVNLWPIRHCICNSHLQWDGSRFLSFEEAEIFCPVFRGNC